MDAEPVNRAMQHGNTRQAAAAQVFWVVGGAGALVLVGLGAWTGQGLPA